VTAGLCWYDLIVSRLNYLGFFYSTCLGQVYATLFPGHLRRMVLDTTADPTSVWSTAPARPPLTHSKQLSAEQLPETMGNHCNSLSRT
jgi:pimeloyl-ACP methyl ester carboxylesterase